MDANQFDLSFVTDLNKGLARTQLQTAFVEEDHQAHVFTVKTTRSGAENKLTGAEIKGYFISPLYDVTVELPGEVNAEGNAVVKLTRDCYAYVGRFFLIIKATIGEQASSIFYGDGAVLRSRTGQVVEPSGTVPSLSALESRIDALAEKVRRTFFQLDAGASASIAFSGQTQAMIYCRGWVSDLAAVFNYSGYGGGTARQGLTTLVNHGGVACGLNNESAGQGMTIKNNANSTLYVCIDLMLGNAEPVITYTSENASDLSAAQSFAHAGSSEYYTNFVSANSTCVVDKVYAGSNLMYNVTLRLNDGMGANSSWDIDVSGFPLLAEMCAKVVANTGLHGKTLDIGHTVMLTVVDATTIRLANTSVCYSTNIYQFAFNTKG